MGALRVRIIILIACFLLIWPSMSCGQKPEKKKAKEMALPKPRFTERMSVPQALWRRRTHRSFSPKFLGLMQLSKILWAAYGVTARGGGVNFKTVPSAGALYPLDIYAVVGFLPGVKGLEAGVYHFIPARQAVRLVKAGDQRGEVGAMSFFQNWVAKAPVIIIITGEYGRSAVKYGERAKMYTHIEAGCVAQSIFLICQAMGLKAGIVGAFRPSSLRDSLGISDKHLPLLIMPVGYGR